MVNKSFIEENVFSSPLVNMGSRNWTSEGKRESVLSVSTLFALLISWDAISVIGNAFRMQNYKFTLDYANLF